jgi:transcription elongation factor Elf1
MALRVWEVERVETIIKNGGWKFRSAYLITCPRCNNSIIVPLSWPRKNAYGTSPCPICFKASRIPGRQYRTQL